MRQLDYLLQRFIDDELTEQERAELEDMLTKEEGAEKRFLRELEVEALLRSLDTSFDVSEKVMPRLKAYTQAQERRRKPIGIAGWKSFATHLGRHPWIVGLGIAAAVALAAGTWAVTRNTGPTITVSEGILAAGGTEQHAGTRRTARLAGEPRVGLARNTSATITFRNGMKMELGLEADMTFEKAPGEPADAARHVRLNSGRLVADVPAAAETFTVDTPQCTALASGARVEVVTNAMATQVRVAAGKARVERRTDHVGIEIGQGQYAMMRDDVAPAVRPVAPLRCLFDDQPDPMAFWTAEAGAHAIVGEDSRSGNAALRITPQQGRVTLSGLAIPIREHPGPGEFRFVAFAWRKDGGGRVGLQFDHADEAADRRKQGQIYGYRYDAGEGGKVDGAALRIDGRTPAAWWLLTRDLWQDFGDFTLTGVTFICPDGESAWFDAVYVAHTPADFETR